MNDSVWKMIGRFFSYLSPGRHQLWILMMCIAAYTCFVCWWDDHGFPAKKILDASTSLSATAVIGLLLIFRNNSAYDRWWEARKLWGHLVNESRNLSIKVSAYANLNAEERATFGRLLAGFAPVLRDHLRGKRDQSFLSELGVKPEVAHAPQEIAAFIYKDLKQWRERGVIDQFEQLQLDLHAKALMDVCGASERILNSPISGSYKVLLSLGLTINVLLLPWLLVPDFDWYTVPFMILSNFFVMALEMLAEEVERPFDETPNDLPLDSICLNIKKSVTQALGPHAD